MSDAEFSLWRDRIKASAECMCNMWFGKWYWSSLFLRTLVVTCQGTSTIVFSSLISIKGFTHIGTHDNTVHCSMFSEILSHSVHCVCVYKHTHIETKHDTFSKTTSRWHILLQVYNRNKRQLTRVNCLMKQHQTSPPTVCLTGRNYSAFCSKFLLQSSCMCLDVYILNCIATN